MFKSTEKIETMIEAMPYIRKFQKKVVVIKYGGHAMINEELRNKFAQDMVFLQFFGLRPVIVHGGGPEITEMLKKIGKKSEFIEGLRITDKETAEIAQMVLVGKINSGITSLITVNGGKAVGLSGKDSNLISAKKLLKEIEIDGQTKIIDIGLVGEVLDINVHLINSILDGGYTPVISPIGMGENGETYNINADTVAGKIAAALQAEKLIMLTDVNGIYEKQGDSKSFISVLSFDKALKMIAEKKIDGGMIPKVEACIDALKNMTKSAHIINGKIPHSILTEIFTDKGLGTMVVI
ncbi:MAG: acetylglutamate kinase [Elusimicrobiota bacterium]|jgi:acetylglutamate kinase|nr:acetylglutamate kinase [Elusimicrobiota bacterium]